MLREAAGPIVPPSLDDIPELSGVIHQYLIGRKAEGYVHAPRATPMEWLAPSDIPRREWLYGGHYVRQFLSVTVAPGGVGKSSLGIVEALSMASGRALLGDGVGKPLRVWIFNAEDPYEELQRRIVAAAKHYGLSEDAVGDRLFVDSGRDGPMLIATEGKGGVEINHAHVEAIIQTIEENEIDVLIVDPFIATHAVSENNNNGIDMVAKQFARIADVTDCAVELVHHTRKGKEGVGEPSADDARGASALVSAARSVRVLAPMTTAEAEKALVKPDDRFSIFRVVSGKANMTARSTGQTWRRMVGVGLGNGRGLSRPQDVVGVATQWHWPDERTVDDDATPEQRATILTRIGEGQCRKDAQAKAWVGHVFADVLHLDKKADRKRIEIIVDRWIEAGLLAVEEKPDARREMRSFVVLGSGMAGETGEIDPD